MFEVYKRASINPKWTEILKQECDKYKIEFLTSPYDMNYVDEVNKYVKAYKIGSEDITWLEIIRKISKKNKPVILATGASTLKDVEIAYKLIKNYNKQIVLMQCNTNYTASLENFKYIQLNVLKSYRAMYPELILGLSDHTPGHSTVLGAIALGARIIEKHFTDDVDRLGPDHAFSMNPKSWREMIDRARELEHALGNGIKKVEPNEKDTVIIQRRSLRANKSLLVGDKLLIEDVCVLRPCPPNALEPWQLEEYLGKKLTRNIKKGEHFEASDFK